jgi:hypothetical protein
LRALTIAPFATQSQYLPAFSTVRPNKNKDND